MPLRLFFKEKKIMNLQCSYQIRTISSNVEKEIQRLKAQVDLFWEQELKHYVEFGLRDGLSIAELGSGPGFLTEKRKIMNLQDSEFEYSRNQKSE